MTIEISFLKVKNGYEVDNFVFITISIREIDKNLEVVGEVTLPIEQI